MSSNSKQLDNETDSSVGRFKCKLCDRGFTRKFNRDRHEDTCKPKSDTYHCLNAWCNKTFNKKSNRDRHTNICSKPAKDKTVCFLCKKDYKTAKQLKRHLKSHSNPNSHLNKKSKNAKKVTKEKSSGLPPSMIDLSSGYVLQGKNCLKFCLL